MSPMCASLAYRDFREARDFSSVLDELSGDDDDDEGDEGAIKARAGKG